MRTDLVDRQRRDERKGFRATWVVADERFCSKCSRKLRACVSERERYRLEARKKRVRTHSRLYASADAEPTSPPPRTSGCTSDRRTACDPYEPGCGA